MYKSIYGGAIFIATKILLYSASSTSFSLIMEIPEGRRCRKMLKQPRGAMVPRRNDLPANQSNKDGASPKEELLPVKNKESKEEDI